MRLLGAVLFATAACTPANELARRHSRADPVDAVLIPGCPTAADGALSRCLARRIAWGAHVWEQGLGRFVVVSGAAAYNRYVEAEALAAGLAALGVPPTSIWLEPHALHTDENVYYGMHIAESLGARTFAVASDPPQAAGACSFVESWQRPCVPAPMDVELVEARLAKDGAALAAVRVVPVPDRDWLPVMEIERRGRADGGRRPSSLWVYLFHAPFGRLFGDPWVPPASPDLRPLSYAEILSDRSRLLAMGRGALTEENQPAR